MNNEKAFSFVLYQALCGIFCTIVLVSNIISAKMVPLPFFHVIVPAGIITYPFTFLISDLVTEFFGPKKAKVMVYITFAMNLLSLIMIYLALKLPSALESEQMAFKAIMGLSGIRIFSSLSGYLVAQIIGIQSYAWIKKWTGTKFLWLRNNGSTFLSQMVDTVIVDLLFLYWGLGMDLKEVVIVMLLSFLYKAIFSLSCTPLLYFAVSTIKSKWKRSPTLIPVSLSQTTPRAPAEGIGLV